MIILDTFGGGGLDARVDNYDVIISELWDVSNAEKNCTELLGK